MAALESDVPPFKGDLWLLFIVELPTVTRRLVEASGAVVRTLIHAPEVLGDGTDAKKNTTTQESTGAANWSAIAAGAQHTIALKSDGTLWAWGRNNDGQLGVGTDANKATPTQIGPATWSAISAGWNHTVALKSDDTLWASKWLRRLVDLGLLSVANPSAAKQHRRYKLPEHDPLDPLFSIGPGKQPDKET